MRSGYFKSARTPFPVLLTGILAQVPEGPAADQLKQLLTEQHDTPPGMYEEKLQQALTKLETRTMLFWPPVQHGARYARLIAPPRNAEEDPQVRAIPLVLILFLHSRRWGFLREFVAAGGLSPLVNDLMIHPDAWTRELAIQVLLSIVQHPQAEWMRPAPAIDPHYMVRKQMFDLWQRSDLLRNVFANRDAPSFPTAGYMSLTFLAFYMDWLRVLYCPAKRLYVSSAILDQLSVWAERPQSSCVEEPVLAKRLLVTYSSYRCDEPDAAPRRVVFDFPRCPSALLREDGVVPDEDDDEMSWVPQQQCSNAAERAELQRQQQQQQEAAFHRAVLSRTHRLTGNTAYQAGNLNEAISWYTQSLEQLETAVTLSNRSLVYARRYEKDRDAHAPDITAAEADARRAIVVNPTHVKGYMRLAAALRIQCRFKDGVQATRAGLKVAPKNTELQALHRELSEAAAAAEVSSAAAATTAGPGNDSSGGDAGGVGAAGPVVPSGTQHDVSVSHGGG